MKARTFRVAPGDRIVILPRSIAAGPGFRPASYKSGETFSLDLEASSTRHVRKLVRGGDVIDITDEKSVDVSLKVKE